MRSTAVTVAEPCLRVGRPAIQAPRAAGWRRDFNWVCQAVEQETKGSPAITMECRSGAAIHRPSSSYEEEAFLTSGAERWPGIKGTPARRSSRRNCRDQPSGLSLNSKRTGSACRRRGRAHGLPAGPFWASHSCRSCRTLVKYFRGTKRRAQESANDYVTKCDKHSRQISLSRPLV